MNTSLNWKETWKNPAYRGQLIISLMMIVALAIAFPSFFDFIEGRSGPHLHDVILNVIPAADVAWAVFLFQYSALVLCIISVSRTPLSFLVAMQTYIMVTLLRMLTITLFPLNPPQDYIAMREPIVQMFANHHRIISKDLFFSGHVATICALLFAIGNKRHKWVAGLLVIVVGLLLLVQRNHYTIDVLAAPVITYGCYLVSKNILIKKMVYNGAHQQRSSSPVHVSSE